MRTVQEVKNCGALEVCACVSGIESNGLVEGRKGLGVAMVNYVLGEDSDERRPIEMMKRVSTTWSTSTLGTHGQSAEFILELLDGQLDKFLNEYLKANVP